MEHVTGTTGGGGIYGADGTYLGRLNNNPYGQYGSRYSGMSATNPYTTTRPVVV